MLLAGFSPILKQLQHLSSENDEVAFISSIAPPIAGSSPKVEIPAYAASDDFAFQLGVLRGKDPQNNPSGLSLKPSAVLSDRDKQDAIIKTVGLKTTLDGGQSTALCENLCRGLAFTQGPPGTGESPFVSMWLELTQGLRQNISWCLVGQGHLSISLSFFETRSLRYPDQPCS